METNKILQSDYLDLLFDNRNKSYGGYELRKHYNRRALKALGITFSVILLGIGTPFIISRLNAKAPVLLANNPPDVTTHLTDVFVPPPPEPPHAPKPPEPAKAGTPPAAKTIMNTTPDIVANELVKPDVKPPDIKDLENAVSGPVTNPGEKGNAIAITTNLHTGPYGNSGIDKKGGSGDITSDKPVTFAEVMPEFPGGMAALLAFIQKNLRYPAIAREEGVEGKVVINFIVNALGEIEGAKVMKTIGGGCDKEALRVVNAMPKWKPGKQNGHNVKVYYTLPITFKLQ